MANARAILKRKKAVQNIHKITRTMQLIATARFRKAFTRAVSTKPYTEKLTELVANIAGNTDTRHPLIAQPEGVSKIALLVISSNRGLCGGYNSNILHQAQAFMQERAKNNQQVILDAVGKKGVGHLKFLGKEIEKSYELPDEVSFQDSEKIAERYMHIYTSGEVQAVAVAYMQFHSTSKQSANILQLLPMQMTKAKPKVKSKEQSYSYEFSPSSDIVLDEIIPEAIKVALYQCFTDASVSEQVSRMVAMKAATDNAEKMIKLLNSEANKARQSQITSELSELIGGVEALN